LSPDDLLVVEGVHRVTPGQLVKGVPSDAASTLQAND
jgi:hypothetical protein